MQGAVQTAVAKSGKGAVQGAVQGAVPGAVHAAVAKSGKGAVQGAAVLCQVVSGLVAGLYPVNIRALHMAMCVSTAQGQSVVSCVPDP